MQYFGERGEINFDEECLSAFQFLKDKLISTPMIIVQDWSKQFEVMCDVSGTVLEVMLGKKHNKIFHPILVSN